MSYFKFGNVQCASGALKYFDCHAENYNAARKMLVDFIAAN
jgi:lantibiotic modifying enzyme